jgi:hypothetical protein
LLLLDTEGIASLERSEEANVQIFSLALLFSSFFIYNSMMTIDESAIDRLSLVAEVTKRIRRFADDKKEESPAELAEFFPQLLWLLRDFALELKDKEGRPITPKDYLEQALRPQAGDSARVIERNNIRSTLQQVFPTRDCFTMVRPTQSEKELQEMSNIPMNQLRSEFTNQLKTLQKYVFTALRPKMIRGQPLNGAMLYHMAMSYVDAINKGAVPTIMSAWENVASIQNHEALEEARKHYITNIRRALEEQQPGLDEFDHIHKQLYGEAMAHFEDKGMGMYKQDFAKKLSEAMMQEYQHLRVQVEKNAGDSCAKILDQLWFKLSNVQYNSSDEFAVALKALFNEYNERAPRCLAKMDVLMKFLSGNFSDVISKYVKTHEEAAKAAIAKQKKLKEDYHVYSQRQLQEAEEMGQIIARQNEEIARMREENAHLQSELRVVVEQTDGEVVTLLNHAKAVRDRLAQKNQQLN